MKITLLRSNGTVNGYYFGTLMFGTVSLGITTREVADAIPKGIYEIQVQSFGRSNTYVMINTDGMYKYSCFSGHEKEPSPGKVEVGYYVIELELEGRKKAINKLIRYVSNNCITKLEIK